MKRPLGKMAQVGARQAWLWRHGRSFGEHAFNERPRLLVDVSAILRHDAQTGIQRVVRAVWSELRRRRGAGFELVPVYAGTTHGYCRAPADFLERKGIGAFYGEEQPVRVAAGDKFLGLDLSAHVLPKYRRQLKAWQNHGASIHLVVYDLLPLERPAWFTRSAVNHFRRWFELLTQQADQAICISDHVARELQRQLASSRRTWRPEIARMRMGADIAASVPSSGLGEDVQRVLEHLRFRPAILMVGTVEPRKGYEAALAAFEHLWRTRPDSPDLVIVGKPGWKTEAIQTLIRSHQEFGRRIHWFDRMSDEGLCLLYDGCRGVLMASRGEGWGLPLVEAAMHRRYVLARDLPVFREHGLPNLVYFSDDSPQLLAERLMQLANIGQTPAPLTTLTTWSDCVSELLHTIGIVDAQLTPEEPLLRKAS